HQLGEAVVNLSPCISRHHGFERRVGHLDRQIAIADITGIDDPAIRLTIIAKVPGSHQEACYVLDRLLRRREADPCQWLPRKGLETFERQSQMESSLVADHGVYLIDDHAPRRAQHLPARLGTEQEV